MRLSRKAWSCSVVGALLFTAVATAAPAALAQDTLNHIQNVAVQAAGAGADVVIEGTSPPVYSAQLASGGKRLIVDIGGADMVRAVPAHTQAVGVLGGVVAQVYDTPAGKTTRVFIQLREACAYRIRAEQNRLVVSLKPGASSTFAEPRDAASAIERPAATTAQGVLSLTDVRFQHQQRSDQVILAFDGKPVFAETSPRRGLSRMVVRNASLAKGKQRTIDVSAFGGVVRSVTTYPSGDAARSEVVVEVERDENAVGAAVLEGNSLVWTFARNADMPSSLTGVGADGGAARRTRTVAREPDFAGGSMSPASDQDDARETATEDSEAGAWLPGSTLGQQQEGDARGYRGRRIDLDLKDADIHNVLRLLADVGRVNIVTADNVKGEVTIRMRNVPWDRALDVVLQAKSLGMVREGNVLRVAPLADLEKEREMAIQRRKQEFQLQPVETRLVPVSYAQAEDIQSRAKDLLSSRGSIAVDQRTNMLIVRDIAGNLNQIEELVRSLDSQTPQVLVEARIVEATSRYLRDIGVQWGGDATFSAATGNPTGLAFPSSIGVAGGADDGQGPTAGLSPFSRTVQNPNYAVNLPAAVGTGSGGAVGITFGHINNTFNLALRLSAAETSGMVRIISSPRILTLDNNEATISQGTLIPFSQVSAMGVQTTFREAKLELRVRPHVTADGSVAMHVKVNRDEPDFTQTSARGDPTILKREAETNLLVMDGHTAVIGGIFTRNTGRNLDQVPFFGDIPLLGLLFQRRRASDARGELVIFITPRIVNRAEALGR